MTRVLITAFESYGNFAENASWLAMVELTKELPEEPQVTTRRYPVDFDAVAERLAVDLADGYDFTLHLGQAPGSSAVQLEAIGVNVRGEDGQAAEDFPPLLEDGPAACRSSLPLGDWAKKLRAAGIPAQVSWHAGTYLCNATLFLALHHARERGLTTQSTFIHLPLATSQAVGSALTPPSLPSAECARAVALLLGELASQPEA